MTFKVEREIGSSLLSVETGKIAKQATGAVVVRYGDTVVLGTVVWDKPRPGIDFFPLTVDYREKMSAAGKFPGGFFKREGRPTQKEILTMRMIDRPLRPMFPSAFKDEIQIQIMVLAACLEHDPDIIAMIAANAAMAITPVPFNGPLGATRVGRVDGKFIINPTQAQIEYSDLDMVLAGRSDAVNMIEVGSRELSEQVIADAVKFGHKNGVIPICEMLTELKTRAGTPCTWAPPEANEEFESEIRTKFQDGLKTAKRISEKQARNEAVDAVYKNAFETYCPEGVETPDHTADEVKAVLQKLEKKVIREQILKEGVRPDGRGSDEIRPLSSEVGWLPRTHGSSLFTRGQTQSMVTVTLGTSRDEQTMDELLGEYSKKFLLHYNFPPFSVGEARRIMGPGRREIGHGALAERSLEAVLPSPDDFPYTIRVVSDILESNGSSSMASVCAGSLGLMDAGVPIKAAVAGVSIGMVQDGDKHVLLADILGEEDHFGDMDFKVAGTRAGITGVQLDLKNSGLSHEIISETLALALKCRLHILDHMATAISEPRAEISKYAPRLITVKIDPEKIGKVIGPGGKGIKKLQADTGAQIDIENDGTVFISCMDAEGAQRAADKITAMTEEIQVGRIYEGRVTSIKDFGAFIEIQEGQDGLCHISELDDSYVRTVSDVISMGEQVSVKVIAIDDHGRVKLSRKAAMKELAGQDKS